MKAQEWKFIIYRLLDNTYNYYGLSVREDSYQVDVKGENMLDVWINTKSSYIVCLRIIAELEKNGCRVILEFPNGTYYKLKVTVPNEE